MAGRTLGTKLFPFLAATRPPSLLRLRPLIVAGDGVLHRSVVASVSGRALRSFSSRPTTSSLNDPSPNWSNRPPKETILLDGCDFEHWLVVMEPPEPNATRDEIIDSYIKKLAEVVGSEQEARMKIYSVSTKHYFAFGALVSEELSYKIKALPKVRWVLPDSYLDVKNKDYGGEPFINGEAVPYDPKYHEEWVRNNARANERSRRNDRPRNFDRSGNWREKMQILDAPPMQNQHFQSNPASPPNASPPPMANRDFNSNVPPPQPPPNVGYQNQAPNTNYQGSPQAYQGQGGGPAYQGQGYQGGNPSYQGGGPGYQGGNPGYQGLGPGYRGGNPGYQGGNPGYRGGPPPPPPQGGHNYQAGNNSGYQGYQGGGNPAPGYQGGSYQGGNSTNYQGGNPGRDVPGRDYQ